MAQFDVYRNLAPSKARVPLLLDVQTDLLGSLATRVVIPLVKPAEVGGRVIAILHFEVEVGGHRYVALTAELAGVPRSLLGARVASLAARRAEILRALDLLVTGA